MSDNSDILGDREYVVTEVVATEAPKGNPAGKWYRYTITNATSPITGVRAGTKKSVQEYAEEFAESLNERALMGYSAYGARRLQKK